MPGVVSTVNVAADAQVEEGQLLMTLEAMKMEVSVFAKSAGTIAELVASPGQAVDAKDLLAVMG